MAEGSDDDLFEEQSIPDDTIVPEAGEQEAIQIPDDETTIEETATGEDQPEQQEVHNIFNSPGMYADTAATSSRKPTWEDKIFGMFRKKKAVQQVTGKPVAPATGGPKPGETTAQMMARIKNEKPSPAGSAKKQEPEKKEPQSYVGLANDAMKKDIRPSDIPKWDLPETKPSAPKRNYLKPIATLLALIVLAIGAYSIYSELPTHPMLAVGIVMCSAASGIVMSNMG